MLLNVSTQRFLAEFAGDGNPEATSAEVAGDFTGGVGAGSAGETVAGVRAGTTQVEPANRRAVARPIEHRAHGEQLIERKFGVIDVAAGKAVGLFQIFRRD